MRTYIDSSGLEGGDLEKNGLNVDYHAFWLQRLSVGERGILWNSRTKLFSVVWFLCCPLSQSKKVERVRRWGICPELCTRNPVFLFWIETGSGCGCLFGCWLINEWRTWVGSLSLQETLINWTVTDRFLWGVFIFDIVQMKPTDSVIFYEY